MSTNVDVHLIIDSFDRQFNSWRNVARLFARTNYVMMLDVDFAICTDFREAIRSSNIVMDKLREGQSALVIPAFEFINHSEGLDSDRFPKDKEVSSLSPRFSLVIFASIIYLSLFSLWFEPTELTCFIRHGSEVTIAQITQGTTLRNREKSTESRNINLLMSRT